MFFIGGITNGEKKLDLVLVAPQGNPPVCKIMNYGKYKFEQAKREKEAKKKQKTIEERDFARHKNAETICKMLSGFFKWMVRFDEPIGIRLLHFR